MATKKPIKKSVKKPINQDRANVALLFGIMSFFGALVWFFGLLFGVLGIAFGIGAIRARQDKGRAVAGIIMGVSGVLLSSAMVLIIGVLVHHPTQTQRAADIQTETQSLAYQLSNLVDRGKGQPVKISELSISGFKVIKSINASGKPTQSTAIFTAGVGCSGATGPDNYTITYLDDSNVESCTGYEQN